MTILKLIKIDLSCGKIVLYNTNGNFCESILNYKSEKIEEHYIFRIRKIFWLYPGHEFVRLSCIPFENEYIILGAGC